ncbi:hypothetical protein [Candidatus Albibeggiatoa sp. nov. BB20]|uniref:hypothetical protein n=1 Tax=Candidatus Albibeggiatoa sp. nov. BB20 TaxID=3162723 RepID=UPI0033653DBE
MKQKFSILLEQQLPLLDDAAKVLVISQQRCTQIGIKETYTIDELEKFEALTSRFARLCDFVIQKMLRLIDEIDLETQGTVRDRIHRAEKKGLIKSAEQFADCRMLRNEISHEYTQIKMLQIFQNVLEMTPYLLESVDHIKQYCQQFRK